MKNCTVLLLSLNSVFFYTTPNGKWLCKLIQTSGTDLYTPVLLIFKQLKETSAQHGAVLRWC
jgi:hypothetical protein